MYLDECDNTQARIYRIWRSMGREREFRQTAGIGTGDNSVKNTKMLRYDE